jgi:hypothetical protein
MDWFIKLLIIDYRLVNLDFYRACGEVNCKICKRKYYEHPLYYKDNDFELGFTLLCNGDLVHL